MDTPGSNINRRTTVELQANADNWKYFAFGMEMPIDDIKVNKHIFDFNNSYILVDNKCNANEYNIYGVNTKNIFCILGQHDIRLGKDEETHKRWINQAREKCFVVSFSC